MKWQCQRSRDWKLLNESDQRRSTSIPAALSQRIRSNLWSAAWLTVRIEMHPQARCGLSREQESQPSTGDDIARR
jgi:hypothetical protein